MAPPSSLSVQNFKKVPWLIFHESPLISFAGSDFTSNWQGGWDKWKRRWWKGWGEWLFEGGDYLYFHLWGGGLFEGGRRLIEEGD